MSTKRKTTQSTDVHLPTIAERAILVNLKIGMYSGIVSDDEVSRRVAEEAHARAGIGTYRKVVVPKVALAPVRTRRNIARSYHQAVTLPWGDGGDRLLPTTMYFEYAQTQHANERAFLAAAKRFCEGWDGYVGEARNLLGRLWRAEDYPTAEQVAQRFYFHTTVLPIPSVSDFRVDLGKEEVTRVKGAIEAAMQERFEGATRDLWVRLHGAVAQIAKRLSEEDTRIRESLFVNLRELTGLLTKLNFTGDTKLEEMRQEVEAALCGADVEGLRKSKAQRATLAKQADKIAAALEVYAA